MIDVARTLDEAIAQERENGKLHRDNIIPKEKYMNMPWIDSANKSHTYYAEYHEQLAEWLEELKALRENSNGYSKEDIELNRKAMYNKALDDLIEAAEKSQYGDVDGKEYVMEHLKALAERLKAGGENEQSI